MELKTRFLSFNSNECCDGLKLILQEKRAGKISNKINEEIVAITDKLLEKKCISTKQQRFFDYELFKLNENYDIDRRILILIV